MRYPKTMLATAAFAVVATAAPTSATQASAGDLRDVRMYAADHDVTVTEALRRFALQDRAGGLEAALAGTATFGGLYVTHRPAFRVNVNVTAPAAADAVRAAAARHGLADVTDVRTVRWSLAQLVGASSSSRAAVARAGLPAQSGVDVAANRAEVYVADPAAVTRKGVRVAAPAVLVRGVGRDANDVYGGLAMGGGCTTGFSVYDSMNYKGVMTAGHCSDSLQQVNGAVVELRSQMTSGAHDQQWHLAPGHTIQPRFFDGSYTRNVTGLKARSAQTVGEYVCKYGRITIYTCGYINDKNFNWGGNYSSPTWIRVNATSGALVQQGDSGGPWFNGNTAFGITKGVMPDGDGVYQAIDYMTSMGVFLMTV